MNKRFSFNDRIAVKRYLFITILLVALFCFELFNYSSTEYSFSTFFGDLSFLGLQWSMLLAVAFCAADFGGIARVLTPQRGRDEPVGIWLVFAGWIAACFMNAFLTWWAVASAMAVQTNIGNEVLSRETLLTWIPIFVATLVLLIRITLIGTFTVTGDNLGLFGKSVKPVHTPFKTDIKKPAPQPQYATQVPIYTLGPNGAEKQK